MLAVAVWNVFPVTTDALLETAAFGWVGAQGTTNETLAPFVTEVRQQDPDLDVTPEVIAGHPADEARGRWLEQPFVLQVSARRRRMEGRWTP